MQLTEVDRMARSLMYQHGLYDWKFKFDNGKVRAGACNFRTKTISLSRHLMPGWAASEVRNTILHEIAHAMAGPNHDHDRVWRAHAVRIGCTGNRCWKPSEDAPMVAAPWLLVCPNGHSTPRYKRVEAVRARSCGKCSRTYNPAFALRWERNPVA